jgi:BioD-like phosphotransacetylase family protein
MSMHTLNRLVVAGLAFVIVVLMALEGLVWHAAERSSNLFYRMMDRRYVVASVADVKSSTLGLATMLLTGTRLSDLIQTTSAYRLSTS